MPKARCSRCSACRTEDLVLQMPVFPSVFIWMCVGWQRKAASDLFFFLLHKTVDTFSSMIFAAFVDKNISERAERAASSNRVTVLIEMISSLTQTPPYALL